MIFKTGVFLLVMGFIVSAMTNPSKDPKHWDWRDAGTFMIMLGIVMWSISLFWFMWLNLP